MSEVNSNFPAENDYSIDEQDQAFAETPEVPNLSTEESSAKGKQNGINWHKLAHKLREHNRKLLKKVFQLEQEVIEANQALEEQQQISRSNDLYAGKQAKKINQYQEEIARLLQKIEDSQQESDAQQDLVKELNQKLEISQNQINTLNQECATLEQSNKEKAEELQNKQEKIAELTKHVGSQQKSLVRQKNYQQNQHNKIGTGPIKAWSAGALESEVATSASIFTEAHLIEAEEWPAPSVQKKRSVNSISAVQLPRFPRRNQGS